MNTLVLLSGGQDSATCLAWAKEKFSEVHTIVFDYGQRHRIEIECSKKLSEIAKVKSYSLIRISSLKELGNSALLNIEDKINGVHPTNNEVPASFVPGRNYIFLGLAAAKAYSLGIKNLITGVCQTDFSGYADCRDLSIKAVEVALSLCFDSDLTIYTPLMWKTKAETVSMMKSIGQLYWYGYTHTCYEGKRPPCGNCPACILRAKGFEEAKEIDPLLL